MCTGKQVLRYFIILLSLACPSNIYLLIIIVVDQVGTCWGLQTGNIRWRKHERVWIFLHNSKVKTILDWMIWTNNISGIKWIFVPSFDWETYNCAASRTGDNRVPTSPPASGSPRVWWSPCTEAACRSGLRGHLGDSGAETKKKRLERVLKLIMMDGHGPATLNFSKLQLN